MKKIYRFLKTKTGIVTIVVVVIVGGWILMRHSGKTTYQFVPVRRGSITEVVSVTGNVTSTESVDLGFENGGTIASVAYQQGDHVPAGATIAALDVGQLEAQLAQAQANVQAQQATLENMEAGATPQSIAVSETAVAAARQTLQNSYASVPNAVAGAYTNANDAVRNQLNSFFTNAETANPLLTFQVSNSQIVNDIEAERLAMSNMLNSWQTADQSIGVGVPSSTLDTALTNALANLNQVKTFLMTAQSAVVNSANMSPAVQIGYKTDVTNGMNEVNTSIGALNSLAQSIASEKASVAQAQAQLNLTLAGSTEQEIDAQKAQVAQAQANVQAIQAQIANSYIVAPMSGVITTQNAKVGEVATPGVPLISMISPNSLEIDVEVPEVDISKIALNDPVAITLDAFPNETFAGKVFFINPAETISSGVVDYEVKIAFDKSDPRLRSGLTANLNIVAQTDSNVLILPQYAILQNATGTFVETVLNGAVTTTPVTLGISDDNGNVEVTSGVSDGEQIVNVGLK
jgi:HlyD family secretion protein